MPRGTIDWKSTDSYTRLLAAIVASNDMKLNYKKIADMYGEGATYNSIEGRFRIIRKEADKLKTEIDNGVRAPAPARGTGRPQASPRKPRTPKHASVIDLEGVLDGRVSKSAVITPTKRRSTAQMKEMLEASTSTSSSGDVSGSNGSDESRGGVINDFSFDDSLDLSFVTEVPGTDLEHDLGKYMMMQEGQGSGYWVPEDPNDEHTC